MNLKKQLCIVGNLNKLDMIKKLKTLEKEKIVGRLRKALCFTDEPKFIHYFCEPSTNKEINEEQFGSSLDLDETSGKLKSIAENVERFCLETYNSSNFILSSFNKIRKEKKNVLDPSCCINFSEKQLNFKREEYCKKLNDAELFWTEGFNLRTLEDILIPSQLVYVPYDFRNEPIIRNAISTGAAFGQKFSDAIYRGILECIERDAYMIAYLTKKRSPRVQFDDRELKNLKDYFARYLLDLYVFDITSDLSVPTMLSILVDKTDVGPAVSVGLKTDPDPKKAILGSSLEAQHVRAWIRYSYNKENKPKIWASDEIKDLKSRGYYWYNTKRIADLDFLLNNGSEIPLSQIKNLDCNNLSDNLEETQNIVFNKKYDILIKDITQSSVEELGFKVVKVIIPQLHPLYLDEDMPYLWSERLEKSKTEDTKINRIPHPFI